MRGMLTIVAIPSFLLLIMLIVCVMFMRGMRVIRVKWGIRLIIVRLIRILLIISILLPSKPRW